MYIYKAILLIVFTIVGFTPSFAAEKLVTLKIDGMTCASCPYQVKNVLKKVEGVKSARVSLETKEAVVSFDDSLADETSLIEATANAGFPSTLVTAN